MMQTTFVTVAFFSQEYETCIRYEVNVTSCGNIPNIGPNTGTIRCTDGYHYDYTMFGETTITLVSVMKQLVYDAIFTLLFLFLECKICTIFCRSENAITSLGAYRE